MMDTLAAQRGTSILTTFPSSWSPLFVAVVSAFVSGLVAVPLTWYMFQYTRQQDYLNAVVRPIAKMEGEVQALQRNDEGRASQIQQLTGFAFERSPAAGACQSNVFPAAGTR